MYSTLTKRILFTAFKPPRIANIAFNGGCIEITYSTAFDYIPNKCEYSIYCKDMKTSEIKKYLLKKDKQWAKINIVAFETFTTYKVFSTAVCNVLGIKSEVQTFKSGTLKFLK